MRALIKILIALMCSSYCMSVHVEIEDFDWIEDMALAQDGWMGFVGDFAAKIPTELGKKCITGVIYNLLKTKIETTMSGSKLFTFVTEC